MADHRPVPAPHSTGAAVSSSPRQHHTSTSSSISDASSMSTNPTLTDTNSSMETASAAAVPAAAAASAAAPLGCCRWLSSTPPPGPGLGLVPWSHPRPVARHWLLAPTPLAFTSSHLLSVLVFSSVAVSQLAVWDIFWFLKGQIFLCFFYYSYSLF